MRILTRVILGISFPGGWISKVLTIAHGITGTPASIAMRATPVLPR